MKHVLSVLAAFFLCASAQAQSATGSIVGRHQLMMGQADNGVEMRLDCESESSCELVFTAHWKGNPPTQHRQTLRNVHPAEDLTGAEQALRYAVDQRARPIRIPEFAVLINKLQPVLSSNPSISKCWDLNYTSPGYMLACTFADSTPDSPSVYLFATFAANCGEAFCKYLIYPLSPVK